MGNLFASTGLGDEKPHERDVEYCGFAGRRPCERQNENPEITAVHIGTRSRCHRTHRVTVIRFQWTKVPNCASSWNVWLCVQFRRTVVDSRVWTSSHADHVARPSVNWQLLEHHAASYQSLICRSSRYITQVRIPSSALQFQHIVRLNAAHNGIQLATDSDCWTVP